MTKLSDAKRSASYEKPFKNLVGKSHAMYQDEPPMEVIKYILAKFKWPSFDRDKVEWLVERVEELEAKIAEMEAERPREEGKTAEAQSA